MTPVPTTWRRSAGRRALSARPASTRRVGNSRRSPTPGSAPPAIRKPRSRRARGGTARSRRFGVWFQAIHLLTSHSNGISAKQAQAQLRLGIYKTAWLLLHKPCRAMVNPERIMLAGIV